MRVKPAPGTYLVTFEGSEFPVIVTADGAMCMVKVFCFLVECEWEWYEHPGGPILMPGSGLAVQFVGFNDDGTCDIVFKDGSGKSGTYAPA